MSERQANEACIETWAFVPLSGANKGVKMMKKYRYK